MGVMIGCPLLVLSNLDQPSSSSSSSSLFPPSHLGVKTSFPPTEIQACLKRKGGGDSLLVSHLRDWGFYQFGSILPTWATLVEFVKYGVFELDRIGKSPLLSLGLT